mmetsp:Transcript_4233/g.16243  ORF Transcript_4233/g.16243 Transcript_4233/m.16243 type:complete len:109 (-) Transcript_4233:30-356(-)
MFSTRAVRLLSVKTYHRRLGATDAATRVVEFQSASESRVTSSSSRASAAAIPCTVARAAVTKQSERAWMRTTSDGAHASVTHSNRANADFVPRSDEDARVASRSMLDT